MLETLKTLRAAWPMLSRAVASGQLFRPQCTLIEPDPDIRTDVDVEIPMRDGYALTANIYRSKARMAAGAATPVIMCAHPYDNHLTPALGRTPLGGPPQQYRLIRQAGGAPEFSTLTSWESPDPNVWVPAGYALVNMNLPGYANSGGPASVMSRHQGACYREAIAWVGAQDWCDGNVGLCGVSYLAISQFHAAAAPSQEALPEALKCICPWEGLTDIYHDLVCPGGVDDLGFLDFWWNTEVKDALNTSLDAYLEIEEAIPPETLRRHPLYDAYWKAKAVDLPKITTPMLVCGSFSDHELHTQGSFRAFEQVGSAKKWLYTHRNGKWSEFYSEEATAVMKDFMDHFLRGVDNRFSDAPAVRLEVRSSRDVIHEVRWEPDWPLPNTAHRPLFLDHGRLAASSPAAPGEIVYDGEDGMAAFEHVFDVDTELSGRMKLKLWVEVRPDRPGAAQPDDMIVFAFVDKRDRQGRSVRFNGSVGQSDHMVTRGCRRASRRALDAAASTPSSPVSRGDQVEPLAAGVVVPIEIALQPSSTFFAAGEGLRLIVSAREVVRAPIFKKDARSNRGRHVLRFGGAYDAHLLTPVIPPPR